MQTHFLSFAAAITAGGIGLTNFVSRMIDTAKETSRANIALKNVSGGMAQFARNQEFLLGLSKKYGVQINTLTRGFAGFKAAADLSNISIEDQYKIFESLSRASVAFGLSADDQKGVFLALSQMMSKNKVSSEELRQQMGERLPVAIQAMAKAVGVSVAELEELMKSGKVVSSEVLPKFADALNSLIPNVDTDNLNKSISDLGNTFVEFVGKLDVEGLFKNLVDWATSALQTISKHLGLLKELIYAVFFVSFGRLGQNIANALLAPIKKEQAAANKILEQQKTAAKKHADALQALSAAQTEFEQAENEKRTINDQTTAAERVRIETRANNAKKNLARSLTAVEKAENQKRLADAKVTAEVQAQAAQKVSLTWKNAFRGLGKAARSFGATLKGVFYSNLITGAIALISEVIYKVVQLGRELYRTSRLAKDAKNSIRELSKPVDLGGTDVQLTANIDIVENQSGNRPLSERIAALEKINDLLGTQYTINDAIGGKMDEIRKKGEAYTNLLRAQKELEQAKAKYSEIEQSYREANEIATAAENKEKTFRDSKEHRLHPGTPVMTALELEAKRTRSDANEIKGNLEIAKKEIEDATAEIAKYSAELKPTQKADTTFQSTDSGTTTQKADSQTELQKQERSYTQQLARLQAEVDNGITTEKDFNRARRDLIEKMYVEAQSVDSSERESSEYYKQLEREYRSGSVGIARQKEEEMADAMDEYRRNVEETNRLHELGITSDEEYRNELYNLATDMRRRLGVNLTKTEAELNEAYQQVIKDVKTNAPVPKLERRDTSRDYQKSDIDILGEELEIAKRNAAAMKDAMAGGAEGLADAYNREMLKVDTFEEALKFAEAEDAARRLAKELRKDVYGAITGTVGNVNNIVSAFERVNDVMKSPDASGWEKIMAVWEAMTSLTDAFMETIQMIETITEVTQRMTAAKEAQSAAELAGGSAAMTASAQAIEASAATTSAVASNAATVVAAKTAEGSAAAGASAAELGPFGWLLILPAIMAALSAFAMIPKFEKGGIVGGGSKTGDKILARLNAGEMVLNENQQGTLYGLLNNRPATDVHVSGEFKMRGRDMVAMIDKTERIRQRTR